MFKKWVQDAGVKIGFNMQTQSDEVEVDFLLSYDGEGIKEFIEDKEIVAPIYLSLRGQNNY